MVTPAVLIPAVILSILCVCFGGYFLTARKYDDHRRAFCYKGFSAFSFVAVGLILVRIHPTPSGWLIFCGLFCGLIGDQLLALRMVNQTRYALYFTSGAVVFAVGHIFHAIALLLVKSVTFLDALPLFSILLVCSEFYINLQRIPWGKLHFWGLIYIASIALVTALGFSSVIIAPQTGTIIFSTGSCLFWLSDCFLCAYTFGPRKTRAMNVALHLTYYIGQLLIAWSIAFI